MSKGLITTLPKSPQLSNYQIYQFQILIPQIEDLDKYRVKISCPYLLYFPTNKPSKSVTVEPGRAHLSFLLIQLVLNLILSSNFAHSIYMRSKCMAKGSIPVIILRIKSSFSVPPNTHRYRFLILKVLCFFSSFCILT